MRKISFLLLSVILFTDCKFSRTAEKDLATGISTTGKNLTCDDVYIMVNNKKVKNNEFIYGENIVVLFNDIQGFVAEDRHVFPFMEIIICKKDGDTIMRADDLYKGYTDGMSFDPLRLSADLTVANPIRSGGSYKMIINISDKKGDGTFRSSFDFTIARNERIKIRTSGVGFDEVYLFSQGKNRIITDNMIDYDDNIYIIIEGLRGFKEENGYVFPGLELIAVDSRNNIILKNDDLFIEYENNGIASSDFISRVSAHFNITGSYFNNPLHCELKVWDKRSNNKIEVITDLNLD